MTLLSGPDLIVCASSTGDVWAGTRRWLVKGGMPVVEDLDKLLGADFDVALVPLRRGAGAILIRDVAVGLVRLFERDTPGGATVIVSDKELCAVESMLGWEDEFGEVVDPELSFRQVRDRFGPVGVFLSAPVVASPAMRVPEPGDLVALVLPVRQINDHHTEGS